MKKLFLLASMLIFASFISFGQSASKTSADKNAAFTSAQSIRGWSIPAELSGQGYDIYLDTRVFRNGLASGSIKSISPIGNNRLKSAFLMQTIKADDYRGKRLQISAYVKSENVEHATLWMRMDGEGMQVFGLDVMDNRPIQGTTDWQRYDIVLDVPDETQQIVFGINLKGDGQIWIDDIEFKDVGANVPTTTTKTPAEFAKGSAKRIEQYKTTNKDNYEKQLRAFLKRNTTAPPTPSNLDFENKR